MLSQKGFSPFILLIILTLIGAGYFAGVKSNNSLISNITKQVKNNEDLQKLTPKTEVNPTNSKVKPQNNQKEAYNSQKPYTANTDKNNITFNGTYFIGDYDKTKFTLTLPKNGGSITGNVTGACTGQITGLMETPDSDGDANINGKLEGSCKPVPRFSFKVGVQMTFEGVTHLNTGTVDVTYTLQKPYSSRGFFNLYFTL